MNNDFDMVVLFNKLTGLDDLSNSLWENLIHYHYEKFKFIYRLMKRSELHKSFTFLSVIENDTTLTISINFKSDKKKQLFHDTFLDKLDEIECPFTDKFDISLEDEKGHINISVTNTMIEGDLYEALSNSNG